MAGNVLTLQTLALRFRRLTAILGLLTVLAGVLFSAPAQARTRLSPASPAVGEVQVAGADAAENAEIAKVLALIAAGGPFRHRQDGGVFSNRERRLPSRPRGYYHEYTVETPGSRDRGAHRIIQGAAGETYYTRDHYLTFQRIDAGGANTSGHPGVPQ